MASETAITKLAQLGQSVWLDSINRSLIDSGRLKEMIELGLLGMTSNPTIFDKAVSSSCDYDGKIKELYEKGKSTFEIYDDVTISDVVAAADIFMPVYEVSKGLDGYVSLEINPELAHQTEDTIEEGKRLFKKVNRPNVMFKVPSTDAGFGAIEELLAQGINVNVTLIFSVAQYEKTVNAFLRGMDRLLQKKGDISKVRSVASVFVSRLDTAVDNLLDQRIAKEKNEAVRNKLLLLKGKTAVANAKMIFQKYLEVFSRDEVMDLMNKGLNIQRVLWGSTGTKNPVYSDIKYVEELIAKNTVNTTPQATFEAFMDHGIAEDQTLISGIEDARIVLEELSEVGIDINDVCEQLLKDGVHSFIKSFKSLLESIECKAEKICKHNEG
jgi:transaldolase